MPRCAFLTTEGLDLAYVYDDLAVAPLAARGWTVDFVPWRAAADWSAFDVVAIRSPWDYAADPEAFVAVLAEIEASPARLENPLSVVRWNLRKTYLRDLEAAGVRVVPTAWEDGLTPARLAALRSEWGPAGGVVKPVVGAGARDTFRLRPGDAPDEALAAFPGRAVMAQPFVPAVVDEGEFSVFTFGGAVSHAVLKAPAPGDFRVQEVHGGRIRAVEPEPALLALARDALAAVPSPEPLLYARVDAVRMPDGGLAIIELELVEPSLYFPFAPGAADRFADAVAALG